MITKKELEEIKEIGRAVDALKKDTARIEREVNEIFKRIDPILEKNKIIKEFNYGNKRKNYENI